MRIGIVGTGAMGNNHLRLVHNLPELQLTCAADTNRENLEIACQPYPIKKFSDYSKILDLVDAVMISTPTESHFQIAKFFLENKKHALIEKPITHTVAQADKLIKLAKKKTNLRFKSAMSSALIQPLNPFNISHTSPFSSSAIV